MGSTYKSYEHLADVGKGFNYYYNLLYFILLLQNNIGANNLNFLGRNSRSL